MPKVSLQQMRNMPIFEEMEQPEYVYHMTSRKNAEKILADKRIRVFDDFLCFFFDDPKWIPIYIYLYNVDKGRMTRGFDGRVHRMPPLDHEDTVVLKLRPRRKESLVWYRETADNILTKEDKSSGLTLDQYEHIIYLMYKCRLCHYDNLVFRDDDIEVIPLMEIDAQYPKHTSPDELVSFVKESGLEDDKISYIEHVHDKMKKLGYLK